MSITDNNSAAPRAALSAFNNKIQRLEERILKLEQLRIRDQRLGFILKVLATLAALLAAIPVAVLWYAT